MKKKSVCTPARDGRTLHWKKDVRPPETLCSGNQVTTGEIGGRKPLNKFNHVRLECRFGIGQKYVSVRPSVNKLRSILHSAVWSRRSDLQVLVSKTLL